MFQFKIVLISGSEVVAGVILDQGEMEIKPETWIDFTRLRLGLIFITLDFTWFTLPKK